MTELGIASLALLLQVETPDTPSFPAIWYREVFLGDVAGAATEYRKLLFLSPPSEKLRPEIRQKAAFRAGLCFEKLGQRDYARLAYTSVPTAGSPAGPAVEDALLRLRNLTATQGSGEGVESPAERSADQAAGVSAEVAIHALHGSLEEVERERNRAIAALEGAVASRRESERERAALMERLGRNGVSLEFPEAPAVRGAAREVADAGARLLEAMAPLGESLRAEDLPRVHAALVAEVRGKSLRALASGNNFAARTSARHLQALVGDSSPPDWVRAIDDGGFDGRTEAALAERRMEEDALVGSASLRRQVMALLDKAELMASGRARPDLVVEGAEKIRDLLDWTDPALRETEEIRALSNHATKLFLAAARPAGQERVFAPLWKTARRQVARTIELCGEAVRLAYEDARFRGPARNAASAEAVEACRAEAERLLAFAASELDRGRAGDDFERSLREVMHLLQWVSALEDGRGYRRRADSLLDAKAARAASRAEERKEPVKGGEEKEAEAKNTR